MEKGKINNIANQAFYKAIDLSLKLLQLAAKIVKILFNCVTKFLKKINGDGNSNLRTRIITSLILAPLMVIAIYFSKGLFFLISIIITMLMTFEWLEITKKAPVAERNKWYLIGLIYISVPLSSLLVLRDIEPDIVLWMFFIIWTTDIFAYFAGKNIGGAKLAPQISPNKTWSGLAGGVVASMAIGFVSSFVFVTGNMLFFIFISGLLAIIEQCSDLLESKFKRIFGVKDSGNLIPGHGGVLDRLDGLMLTAPSVLLIYYLFQGKFLAIN